MVTLRDKHGHCVLFPREILVKKAQNVNRQQNYCVNDFRYIGTPNYKQIRLDYSCLCQYGTYYEMLYGLLLLLC